MTTQELRNENEILLRKSNALLKESGKMIRNGNIEGAKLIISRVEEIAARRQENNFLILA